jgi:hypothetical protein
MDKDGEYDGIDRYATGTHSLQRARKTDTHADRGKWLACLIWYGAWALLVIRMFAA